MAKIIALLGIMLAAAHSGFALTCYSCDSTKGIMCDYGLFSFTFTSVECEQAAGETYNTLSNLASSLSKDLLSYSCVKLTGKDKDGKTQTVRGCAPYSSLTGNVGCQALAKTAQFLDGEVEDLDCSTCTTDKCNSAPNLGGAITFMSIVMCSIVMFFNFY